MGKNLSKEEELMMKDKSRRLQGGLYGFFGGKGKIDGRWILGVSR